MPPDVAAGLARRGDRGDRDVVFDADLAGVRPDGDVGDLPDVRQPDLDPPQRRPVAEKKHEHPAANLMLTPGHGPDHESERRDRGAGDGGV